MQERVHAAALAEAIGTYCLVFIGAAVICTDAYSAGGIGVVGVALAHGLVLAAVVTALSHVSGAHVNPAVTFAAMLVGAAAAGLTLLVVFGMDIWDPVALGTPQLGIGVAPGTAILVEAVLSFILVLTVLHTAFDHRAPDSGYRLAIGAVLAALAFSAMRDRSEITG
jgi:glycerol uptake facilitator-like aquaporin